MNKKNELLFSQVKSDFRWDTFRCGGKKGGQNTNKRGTGVRCVHEPSGAVGKSCDERSQKQNRDLAWERCVNNSNAFKMWVNRQIFDITQKENIEKAVGREMSKVKVEVFENGEWVDEN